VSPKLVKKAQHSVLARRKKDLALTIRRAVDEAKINQRDLCKTGAARHTPQKTTKTQRGRTDRQGSLYLSHQGDNTATDSRERTPSKDKGFNDHHQTNVPDLNTMRSSKHHKKKKRIKHILVIRGAPNKRHRQSGRKKIYGKSDNLARRCPRTMASSKKSRRDRTTRQGTRDRHRGEKNPG